MRHILFTLEAAKPGSGGSPFDQSDTVLLANVQPGWSAWSGGGRVGL
jgi:hypothetical protein